MNRLFGVFNKLMSGSERTVKAKKNIIASFIIKGCNILINLAYVPLLIDTLGKTEYGIWLTLTSIISWFGFFDIGLGNGLRNNYSIAVANNNFLLARKYVSTTYAILILIFSGVLVLFYVIAPFLNFNTIFNFSEITNDNLLWLCLIVFTFFILRFIFQLITTILLADQRSAFSGFFNLLSNVLCFVLIVLFKNSVGSSIVLMGSILSVTPIIILVIASIILFKTKYRNVAPSLKYVDFSLKEKLLGLGLKFFVIQIADIVIYSTTNFLIVQLISPDSVAVYNISYKLFQIFPMVYGIILSPIWSATTEAFIKEDFLWIRKVVNKINMLGFILVTLVLLLFLLSEKVYFLWIGDKVIVPPTISFLVAMNTVIYLSTAVYVTFQNGVGKIYLTMYFVIGQAILFIPLSLFLVRYFGLGLEGIILSSILIEIPLKIIQIIQYRKILNRKAFGIWIK